MGWKSSGMPYQVGFVSDNTIILGVDTKFLSLELQMNIGMNKKTCYTLKKWCAHWPQPPKLDFHALSKILLCMSFPCPHL